MNVKALVFALVGAVVALFYGLESFLFFQANGFTPVLLVKLLICGVGVYFCVRNAKRIRKAKPAGSPVDAA